MKFKLQKKKLDTLASFIKTAEAQVRILEGKIEPLILAEDEDGLHQVLVQYHAAEIYLELLRWQAGVIAKQGWLPY